MAEASGYLDTRSFFSKDCQSSQVILSAFPGQKINISVYDFNWNNNNLSSLQKVGPSVNNFIKKIHKRKRSQSNKKPVNNKNLNNLRENKAVQSRVRYNPQPISKHGAPSQFQSYLNKQQQIQWRQQKEIKHMVPAILKQQKSQNKTKLIKKTLNAVLQNNYKRHNNTREFDSHTTQFSSYDTISKSSTTKPLFNFMFSSGLGPFPSSLHPSFPVFSSSLLRLPRHLSSSPSSVSSFSSFSLFHSSSASSSALSSSKSQFKNLLAPSSLSSKAPNHPFLPTPQALKQQFDCPWSLTFQDIDNNVNSNFHEKNNRKHKMIFCPVGKRKNHVFLSASNDVAINFGIVNTSYNSLASNKNVDEDNKNINHFAFLIKYTGNFIFYRFLLDFITILQPF